MKRWLAFVLIFLNLSCFASEQKNDISYSDAIILGAVEGITEYLPVSSTGHLILTNALLGLDKDTPVLDKNNLNILNSENKPYTIKTLADSYCIIIQLGAIASVALIYWQYILQMLLGLIGRNPQGLKLFVNIMVAFLPSAIIGIFAHKIIEESLFGVVPVVCALAVGAVVMFIAQKIYDKNPQQKNSIENLTLKKSLVVGVCQCIAMIPGTSRSMMTILGGYFVGLNAKASATFSFLLGLITLSAASVFKIYKDGNAMLEALSPSPLLLGLIVAFVSSAVAVKWLVSFLTKHGLVTFAIYRILLAIILCVMLWLNLL